MKIKSYLSFNGNAEEALNFYAKVFKGTIELLYRYEDCKGFQVDDAYKNKIMHSDFEFNGCVLSLADTIPDIKADFGFAGHMITVFCDTEQQIREIYENILDGGQAKVELSSTFYAEFYAEVLDKFGVLWALIIENK